MPLFAANFYFKFVSQIPRHPSDQKSPSARSVYEPSYTVYEKSRCMSVIHVYDASYTLHTWSHALCMSYTHTSSYIIHSYSLIHHTLIHPSLRRCVDGRARRYSGLVDERASRTRRLSHVVTARKLSCSSGQREALALRASIQGKSGSVMRGEAGGCRRGA